MLAALLAAGGFGCRAKPADALKNLYDTPELLAEAFLRALEEDDVETLKSLALTEEEFRSHVWPKLPASRPERGVPFEYGWADLNQKSLSSLRRTYSRYRGRELELLEVRFEDGATDYGTFLVHRDARVKVRTGSGEERWLDLFGSVLEARGKYKLFSYVTD
jgi:hypothetical protein